MHHSNDAPATPDEPPEENVRRISLLGREFVLPRSRIARVAIGILLIIGGILGFLPILGFWMIPLGLLVLSYEFSRVRRYRRRAVVAWGRRRRARREPRERDPEARNP